MKVGILTSGGDCQGLNAAIRGVAKALYGHFGKDVDIYGIQDGYRGLIEGECRKMKPGLLLCILSMQNMEPISGMPCIFPDWLRKFWR